MIPSRRGKGTADQQVRSWLVDRQSAQHSTAEGSFRGRPVERRADVSGVPNLTMCRCRPIGGQKAKYRRPGLDMHDEWRQCAKAAFSLTQSTSLGPDPCLKVLQIRTHGSLHGPVSCGCFV